jgi:hypothetical protein
MKSIKKKTFPIIEDFNFLHQILGSGIQIRIPKVAANPDPGSDLKADPSGSAAL